MGQSRGLVLQQQAAALQEPLVGEVGFFGQQQQPQPQPPQNNQAVGMSNTLSDEQNRYAGI